MIAEELKKSILKYAISGKLTVQDPLEDSLKEYEEIIRLRTKLIKTKKIRNENFNYQVNYDEISLDIPKNWIWIKLGAIISLKSGQDMTPDKYNSIKRGIPYITGASNISNGEIDINRWTDFPRSEAYIGDLLITCKGTVGEMAYLKEGKVHIARQIMAINTIGKTELRYIKYFLSLQIVELNRRAKSIIPGIDRKTILEYNFPLPPIEEQKRIVDKLDQILPMIDDLEKNEIKLTKVMNKFPEDIRSSILLQAMEGKLVANTDNYKIVETELLRYNNNIKYDFMSKLLDFDVPGGWRILELNKIAKLLTGNSINATIKKVKYSKEIDGYSYIGTKDVGFDFAIDYKNGIYIPYNEGFKIAPKKSTLLCIEGGSAGRKIGLLNQDVCFGNKLVSIYSDFCLPKYIYYFVMSPIFKAQFFENINGIIGGVGINKIRKILIPVPPLEEQKRIVDKIDQLLPLIDSIA